MGNEYEHLISDINFLFFKKIDDSHKIDQQKSPKISMRFHREHSEAGLWILFDTSEYLEKIDGFIAEQNLDNIYRDIGADKAKDKL